MASVVEAGDADFQQKVIDQSRTVPVVVDFWAPWCGPCRSLGPVLEQLALQSGGKWQLVKVNVDHAPMLSSRFQIQGIPAVKAFVDGKQAAEFVGAQPRHQVEAWLKGFLPDPSEKIVSVAEAAELQGDLKSARAMYEKALKISPSSQPARQGLQRLDLMEGSSSADEAALSQRLKLEPLDVEAAGDLAELRLSRSDPDFAEPLIGIIESEDSEAGDLARKLLLGIIAPFDAGDPRVLKARKRLASVLYR